MDENNNELSRNIYGQNLVSRIVDSNNGYYLYNGHGDVTTIISEDGDILNTYEYDAWGNILTEVETMDNPFRYAGYYYDTETGNYYLLSRYYNPEIARFISEDTYRGELNDPLSLNRYVYVVNNPLIYTDPNGQAPIPVITGAIGGLWGFGSTLVGDLWNSTVSGEWQFSSLETYLGNTIEGGLTGFGLGLCGTACGGLGNFSGNAINQYINTGEVDFVKSGISGLTTLATAGAFSATEQVTSTGLNYIKDYAIRGAFAGVTGDVTYQYLNNGITRDEYGNVTGYSLNQAIDNYNPVQTIKTGILGSILAPIGANITEKAIYKWHTLPKIQQVVDYANEHNGASQNGYKGNRTYENNNEKLPQNTTYKEYDINPKIIKQNRGMERIIIGKNGTTWYTGDHYNTFIEVKNNSKGLK